MELIKYSMRGLTYDFNIWSWARSCDMHRSCKL